jgi:hypothetical protein
MKQRDKERLKADHVKYCKQIGITEIPRLILDRKELHKVQVNAGQQKYGGGWGSCHKDLKTIFVDAGLRIHYPSKEYKGWKNSKRESIKHKSNYRDFRNTQVHELVHYQFSYLQHGKKFEQSLQEILRGRTFEPKEQ